MSSSEVTSARTALGGNAGSSQFHHGVRGVEHVRDKEARALGAEMPGDGPAGALGGSVTITTLPSSKPATCFSSLGHASSGGSVSSRSRQYAHNAAMRAS
jgi:hypothetical protein